MLVLLPRFYCNDSRCERKTAMAFLLFMHLFLFCSCAKRARTTVVLCPSLALLAVLTFTLCCSEGCHFRFSTVAGAFALTVLPYVTQNYWHLTHAVTGIFFLTFNTWRLTFGAHERHLLHSTWQFYTQQNKIRASASLCLTAQRTSAFIINYRIVPADSNVAIFF